MRCIGSQTADTGPMALPLVAYKRDRSTVRPLGVE